jgi:putative salt-induced outer membrane protein
MHRFFASLVVLLSVSSFARAEDLPKGTAKQDAASKGSTDVATGGFEASSKAEDPAKAKDATELALSAGGISTGGNSRSFAATANVTMRIRRTDEQLSAVLAGNYARAKLPGQEVQTTVENEQAKIRYDHFVSKNIVVFLGLQGLRDRFRGLALRAQIDPGVGYYFVNEAKELLWIEGGYDFMYDIRRDDSRFIPNADGSVTELDKTRTVHSGRAFFGYNNTVTEGVAFNMALEYLQALTSSTTYRINFDVGIISKLGRRFSLATTYSLKYDHDPLPGKEKIDHVTSVALTYNFF